MSAHIVVMGVSGCGKTTVAEAIRDQLGYEMAEGDDLHPQANVEKMSAGVALTDKDRWPWLKRIGEWIAGREAEGVSTVVSCSALKRSYRDVLRGACPVYFIHLVGSQKLIASRLAARKGHFMPESLLASQFETLENLQPGEDGCAVSVGGSVKEVEDRAVAEARSYGQWCRSVR